jgi:hypothetical protein
MHAETFRPDLRHLGLEDEPLTVAIVGIRSTLSDMVIVEVARTRSGFRVYIGDDCDGALLDDATPIDVPAPPSLSELVSWIVERWSIDVFVRSQLEQARQDLTRERLLEGFDALTSDIYPGFATAFSNRVIAWCETDGVRFVPSTAIPGAPSGL